jgi:hypothetical protein
MKTPTAVSRSRTHFASVLYFAGFYVVSLGCVVGMIKGTQLLLAMI